MENKGSELRLLKKGQSGLSLLLGPMGIALLLLVVQIIFLITVFLWFEEYVIHIYGSAFLVSILTVLYLLNRPMEPTIRTAWIVLVMAWPVFGTLMYVFTRRDIGQRLLTRAIRQAGEKAVQQLPQEQSTIEALALENQGAAGLCRYATQTGNARLFRDTDVKYLPLGEALLSAMLTELEKAEKFIYLEYFIISEGVMWGKILDVLARKAQEGVDVRVLYDGACEFALLPKSYPERLKKLGIQCKVFSPFKPFVSTHYNYRDHRKIMVIDGRIAFNGGINLADEYINVDSPCGHWKDTAVMLEGTAVRGFTGMFLRMWNLTEKEPDDRSLDQFAPRENAQGFVMPFGDDPMDDELLGHTVYMDMLNRATERVQIMTPYLILDAAMENALCRASRRGVRVQLLLPGIPDKYAPYALAKSHYKTLLAAGIEIYEYTPGFTHGKMILADGREAVVGTVNFDYRSFYHHFECGTYMYNVPGIAAIEEDFSQCLAKSLAVTFDTVRHEKWHRKLTAYLLKGFAPLL